MERPSLRALLAGTRRPSLAFLFTAVAAVSGCVPLTEGELGNGAFGYECSDVSSDAECDGWGQHAPIPEKVAVGGTFSVYFEEDGEGSNLVPILSASPSVISGSDGAFRFEKPGYGAVLAKSGGVVYDFLHLRGVAVDHLVVSNDSLDMVVGEGAGVSVKPVDASQGELAGEELYAWDVTGDTDAITLTQDEYAGTGAVGIQALAPGQVTLKVTGFSKTATVSVVVGGAP